MKQMLTLLFVLVLTGSVAEAQPNVSSSTGLVSFNLSSYGRVRANAGATYVAADRELDRLSFDVGQSDNAVFDYNYDADTTAEVARLISIVGVDSAAESMADNEFSMLPPKVKVRTTVMAWKNQRYFIVRYRIIGDTAGLGSLYMGAVIVPKPGKAYGGETIKYSGARKVTSFFREGEASFWGVKQLGPNPFGVSMLDWDVFSPLDPNSDAATDSTRNQMLKSAGAKDSLLVAGSNGSIFTVNGGKASFTNKGDSVTLYYAVGYGTTENDLYAAMDSATAKYPKVLTGVKKSEHLMPEGFSLEQNYPNPFNPSTQIRFTVGASSSVSLKVFDALGREVRTLMNRQLESGSYAVTLDAQQLSSGMYYYTLQAGSYKETKKMMLMK
jgi:hypothetical protein